MANYIKQVRFYKTNSPYNEPIVDTKQAIISGTAFGTNIIQFGIQTLPGVKFKLNDSSEWTIVGSTGIFELDLKKQIIISKIQFEDKSLEMIENSDGAFLIVDVISDSETEDNIVTTSSDSDFVSEEEGE